MMPLLDMGFMGLAAGLMTPVIGLLRHWAFGLVVAYMYPLPETAPQPASTTQATAG